MNRIAGAIAMLLLACAVCAAEAPLRVGVSVPPLAWFAQELAGPDAEVVTALPPGASPASWDPTPRQVIALSSVDIFVAVGVPMERALLPALRRDGGPRIVDAAEGADLIAAPDHHHHHHGHDHGELDPHVWLSPRRCRIIAERIAGALAAARPDDAGAIGERLDQVRAELDRLDTMAADRLASPTRPLLVQHPAYGYLVTDHGLTMLPVERAGQAPSPAHLMRVFGEARDRGVAALAVQPAFADGQVRKAARAMDLEVVELDPLFDDYSAGFTALVARIATLCGCGEASP